MGARNGEREGDRRDRSKKRMKESWCREQDLNLHAFWALAPKTSASANSAIPAKEEPQPDGAVPWFYYCSGVTLESHVVSEEEPKRITPSAKEQK